MEKTPASPLAETPPSQPDQAAPEPAAVPPTKTPKNKKKPLLVAAIVLFVICLGVLGFLIYKSHHKKPTATVTAVMTKTMPPSTTKGPGLNLDTSKNYGNKYASGVLPVGDSKYVAGDNQAKVGYIYVCGGYEKNITSTQGGASTRGPWFVNNNTEYDINKKAHVQGNVTWQSSFTNTLTGDKRTIVTNDLPNHPTGVFPIARTDPAYAYDKNPNSIKSQTLTYDLSANPTYGSPQCMGGEAGVMLTGVALFNGFDAGGRDAGAWEVQDNCSGHPQVTGEYHYHTLSGCIKDVNVKTVIGYALDGFPITGPNVAANNILTTSDLDECHGITSAVTINGKDVTTYHYVMTQDFPYSVSCFRSTPGQLPEPAAGPPTLGGPH